MDEMFPDGSILYSKRTFQRGFEEFGRVGPTGKTVWKRNNYIYSSSVTENAIIAHTPGANYQNDTIMMIDKKTGKTISNFLLKSVGINNLENYTIDKQQIYISDKNKLIAVRYGGKKAWELTTHSELYKATKIPIGYQQPIIINDNMILTWITCGFSEMCSWIGDDSYQLIALSPKTGKVIWSVPERVVGDYVTLNQKNGQIILDSYDGTVAYRYSDGKKLWSYKPTKSSFSIGQDFGIEDPDGKIYLNVINENKGVYSTSRFISLNADGSVAWTTTFNAGAILNLRGFSQDKKILYFESNLPYSNKSKFYLVDRRTGKKLSKGKYDLEYPIKNGHVSIERTNSKNGFNRATIRTANGAKIGRIDYRENEEIHVGPDYRVYILSDKLTSFSPQTRQSP
ncbi:PQQ-binding-like beta-propeller repeat protein [Ureibacillus composti]